jgi:ribosomal protein L40E
MYLLEEIIAIIVVLTGIGLLAYVIRSSMKETKKTPEPKIYCISCGTANSLEATFCAKCGRKNARLPQNTSSDKGEEKEVDDKEADLFFNADKDNDLIFPEDGI